MGKDYSDTCHVGSILETMEFSSLLLMCIVDDSAESNYLITGNKATEKMNIYLENVE